MRWLLLPLVDARLLEYSNKELRNLRSLDEDTDLTGPAACFIVASACRRAAYRARKRADHPDPPRVTINSPSRAPLELVGHGFRWAGAVQAEIAAVIPAIIESEIGKAATAVPLSPVPMAARDGKAISPA